MSLISVKGRLTPRRCTALFALGALCALFALATSSVGAQEEPPQGEVAPPTRTRRPTRTPRATATPTTTPLPAGVLRMVIALDPVQPAVGEPFEVSLRLQNVDTVPALDLTIEVQIPPALLTDGASAARGEVARAEETVHWFLPRLEASSEATLRVIGVAGSTSVGLRGEPLCALLLSRGAPIEHCIEIRIAPSKAVGLDSGGAEGAGLEPLPTAVSGLGFGDILAETPRVLAGWGLLALGLGVLGLWAGVSARRLRSVANRRRR